MTNENNYEPVELYKNRTLGERFSASAAFIRQNWKMMAKSFAYIGIPLSLIYGYLMQRYFSNFFHLFSMIIDGDTSSITNDPFAMYGGPLVFILIALFSTFFSLFIIGTTGAIFRKYKSEPLGNDSIYKTSVSDVLNIAGKIFVQGLVVFLFLSLLIFCIVGIMLLIASLGSAVISSLIGIVLWLATVAGMIILIPGMVLMPYSIIFENASPWVAIKRGIRLGFRYWGSTFLTLFVSSLLMGIVSYMLTIPSFIYVFATNGGGGAMGLLLGLISSLSNLIMMPIYLIFLGFQYTSIVEKEEGVSLQNHIDEFERL